MSGNYRPRRRHGPSGNAKAPSATSGAGQANRAGDGARAKRSRLADPRRTAYDVLAAVRDRAAYANLLLPRLLAERGLSGRDAALTTELAYGTLRGQGTYDAILTACSDRPLDKLDPPVLDVLRLGAHQLLNTRIGAHAAVATSVDLAKSVIGPRVSGYVNAVLRRVATRDLDAWLDIVAPSPVADQNGYLATRYSHPRWIVAAYRAALGDAADTPAPAIPGLPADEQVTGGAAVTELEAALAAGNTRPRVTMAAFPAGPPREDVMPADADPGRWSPYAFTLRSGDPAPLVESGAAAVQDEGSQLAAMALARAPVTARPGQGDGAGERWLDLCAGPGGKSRLLYGLAQAPRATLTAAELHPHRATLVRDTLNRASRLLASPAPPARGEPDARGTLEPSGTTGTAFEVVVADGTRPPWPDGTFDRVLVDVPCTGLGALRRRPEARWRKSEDDLKELTALQRDLLRSALACVRPGGVVAYVTCSPVPAETGDVVADVVASTPGVDILDTPALLPGVPGTRSADPRLAQLWPHRHGTDAIFIALLQRSA
jgi:16S rRNA (cytosine967-C5)-methyltransferase